TDIMCIMKQERGTAGYASYFNSYNDFLFFFFFSSRRRHTRFSRDWSSDVCSSDLKEASASPNSPLYDYARWWRELRLGTKPRRPAPCRLSVLPGPFPGAELGALRRAKIAAWYLLRGITQEMLVRGSNEYAGWLERFWTAVRRI